MSQWAEIRHCIWRRGYRRRRFARRLQLDVKTVRRAVDQPTPPVRVSPPRVSSLDPWRDRIEQWLREDRKLTAKRIRRLLLPLAGAVSPRTVRRYVAALRRRVTSKEAFVHRSVAPGTTMEVDFGESWVDIAGAPCKVKYLVATLPFSNAYFRQGVPGRAARVAARRHRVGVRLLWRRGGARGPRQHLAGGQGHPGRSGPGADRGVRGVPGARIRSGPSSARRPRAGRRGSVENGVKYVRNLVFRPRLAVESWAALNAAIRTELEADLPTRHLDDGCSAQEALTLERQHLRAMPAHLPATCRLVARVADKSRARPGGQGHLFGADPPRLAAGVGEAVSRPGGDCRRRRSSRRAPPGVLPGREGPRPVPRAAAARAQAPGRGPRRRRWSIGAWRRCGSRCGTSWRNTPASPIRSGSGCCG